MEQVIQEEIKYIGVRYEINIGKYGRKQLKKSGIKGMYVKENSCWYGER